MLGALLRYQSFDNQQNMVDRLNTRDKLVRERRDRIKEETRKLGNPNDGMFEKLLSIGTLGVIIGNINKLFEQMEKTDSLKDMSTIKAFLSKVDPSASEKDIEEILDLMDMHIDGFNKDLMKSREIEYEMGLLQQERLDQEIEIKQNNAIAFNIEQQEIQNKKEEIESSGSMLEI